ncbi:CPBP family intramembrane glutamic endopeptidase [Nonomuraea sp. LPB2021202275-12-8]|uniref:CPBP family intramembrane glutamic endopeptidase n=1 Tax=Nonomuraea sp. LPB2021202275-12-8 TaxID=3120159 RepID=UPI00300C3224
MGLTTKGVLTFLLISFGLAWGAVLVAHFVLDMSLVNPLVQLPMAFSPAIAAVIVRLWVTGEGFRDAGLRPRVRAAGVYYLLAWIGPVLVLAVTVGLAIVLGLYRLDFSPLRQLVPGMDLPVPAVLLLLLAAPVLLLPAFWGEEFGWRSYLQPRASRSLVQAALITGIIWSVWHYPLVFTDYVEYSDPFLGLATWTLLIVAQAIILAWLFLRSGSVWVPCLAHAGNNLIIGTFSFLFLAEGGGLDMPTIELLQLVPLSALCAWILLTGRLHPSREAKPAQRDEAR